MLMPPRHRTIALLAIFLLILAGCNAERWGELGGDNEPAGDDDDSAGDDDDSADDDDTAGDDDTADDDDTAPIDSDNDGFVDDEDCGPDDPLVHPDAEEICDDLDTDCDGQPGDGTNGTPDETDFDGDGISVCSGDCNDLDSAVFPGAAETCDGIDSDCNGEAEETPTGDPQEMFIGDRGRLYVTILSVDAGCQIHLAMDAPVVIADMVGEVHSQIGSEVDVGQVLPCSAMHFTSTSCSTQFSTLDPAAFHVIPLGPNHWRLEHEDGADNDYNDVIFEALVETRN